MSDEHALSTENEQLRRQVASLTVERDAFRRALLDQLARTETGFTPEQLAAGVPTGPWFEQFLARLEGGDPSAADVIPTTTAG